MMTWRAVSVVIEQFSHFRKFFSQRISELVLAAPRKVAPPISDVNQTVDYRRFLRRSNAKGKSLRGFGNELLPGDNGQRSCWPNSDLDDNLAHRLRHDPAS
jgi:hypothetical protein